MRTPVQIRKALACLFRAIDSYSWKKICLSFFFPLLLIQFIKAQDHPCYENPNCTSSDITIVGGSLASNIDGTPLIIDDCNTPPANAYLCITFLNGTGSPRNGIYMEGTITSGDKTCDIDYCFNDLLPPGTPTQVCAPAPVFEWNCMESVYLSDILTIWGPNSGQVCPGNTLDCNTTTKSKCFYSPDDSLMISIPLIPNFNFTKSCESNDMVETVTFNSTTVGGKEPYQSYLWEFGDGSTDSNNPTSHLYSGIGTFEVTLTVTDFVGHAEAIIKSVDVGPCCSFDITCPDDVTFDCDNIPVNKFDAAAGIINNYCGSISINDDFIHPGNCGGAVLTTFTIVDDQGTPLDDSDDIEITCVAEITINESPLSEVIDPVLPAVLNCEQAAEFIAPDAQYTNGLSGTCGISGNISPQYVYDYTNCGGFIEISYMDTDECFNNISAGPFTILVEPAP